MTDPNPTDVEALREVLAEWRNTCRLIRLRPTDGDAAAFVLASGAVVPASRVEEARREGAATALREAADEMAGGSHNCFRPQGCVECGRQNERDSRRGWLYARAHALTPTATDAPEGER